MALESPRNFEIGDDGRPVGDARHTHRLRWVGDNEFGAYVRQLRRQRGWSTREAAPAFGKSQAFVSKLENTVRSKPPSLELLKLVAEVFECDLRDVLHEAGFRFDVLVERDFDAGVADVFDRLMRDPRFGPRGFKAEQADFYAPRMKRQVVDLVLNVWRATLDDDFDLEEWLDAELGGEG